MIRTTEEIARENVQGYLQDITGLINPANDGMLAAWQMAATRAEDLARDLQTVCRAIAARPGVDGNTALRAIADEPPFSEESFADDIRRTVEARRSIRVETPEEAEALDAIEARQVDLAKPEVFNIQGWTHSYFGMDKGA